MLGGVIGALIAAAAAREPSPGAPSDADLRALAATGALLHGVAGRIAAGLAPLAPADSAGDAAQGRPITALDVAHALPEAVASIRQSGARDDEGAPQHRPAARP